MSYNTRRSGPQQPPQQQAASVGQRRPVVTNNFVAASQQSGQQQQRPPQQQQQQQRPAQQPGQQASQVQFRQQQQPVKPQTPAQQQYNQQQQAQRAAQLSQQQRQAQGAKPVQQQQTQNYQTQSFVKQEPAPSPVRPAAAAAAAAPVVPGANPPPPDTSNGDSMDTDDATRKKKPWMMKGGKISKKEKLRRRNLRLSKMLQPKNAVMILNELVKNTSYTVEELGCKVDNNQYKAVVTFEGEDHVGLGRSKIQAKNSAAEAALKYLIKNKQLKLAKSEPESGDDPMDGNESMELTTEDGTAVLPWQHVASFALFKLFSSWGEDPMGPVRQAQELLGSIPLTKPPMAPGTKHELKPAKALPANPETMNPIMLLNQMQPNVQYEEVGKSGLPPNVTFTYNVFVNDQTFSGTGNNKKAAKKMAAYSACHNVYNIHYPADVWTPLS